MSKYKRCFDRMNEHISDVLEKTGVFLDSYENIAGDLKTNANLVQQSVAKHIKNAPKIYGKTFVPVTEKAFEYEMKQLLNLSPQEWKGINRHGRLPHVGLFVCVRNDNGAAAIARAHNNAVRGAGAVKQANTNVRIALKDGHISVKCLGALEDHSLTVKKLKE